MTGYVRKDTTNNIADGNVINAADLDSEFDGVQDAFNASTGHKHDGTAGEGATINALGPTQDVTVSSTLLAPKTTNTVDIGSSALKFKDLFLAGNASVGGTLAVTGVATFTAQPILSSLTASRAVFSDGSKGLVSNAITGTGNVVMSASPTLTGTVGGASLTLSSLTAGRVTYAGTSGLLQDSANLTFNGTTLTANTLSLTNALATTSGGTGLTSFTSGGVVYASSSSALATGSALTFDGTSLDLATVGAKLNFATTSSATRNYVGGSADGYSLEMVTQRGAIQPLSYKQDFGAGHIWSITGSEVFRATSTSLYTASGINVGIGTSSPSEKLVVNGNARLLGGGYLQLFNSTNASNSGLATDATGLLLFSSTSVTRWLNNTLAVEQMRLDSAGNLQLSTASTGILASDGYTMLNQTTSVITIGATNRSLNFACSASANAMVLDTSGNLVIGTTSTSAKFEVSVAGTASYSSSSAPTANILLSTNGAANSRYTSIGIGSRGASGQSQTNYITNVPEATDGNAALAFSTYGSYAAVERLRITSAGNVGIGTNAPNGKFEVASAAAGETVGLFLADATNNTVYVGRLSTTVGSGSSFVVRGRQGTAVFTANSDANNVKTSTTLGVGNATPADGAGITFPATQSASSDANTLDDYEEGTWTPNQGAGLTVIGTFSSSGTYTKIGRFVYVKGSVNGSTSIAVAAGSIITGNLPFSAANQGTGTAVNAPFNVGSVAAINSLDFWSMSAIGASGGIVFSGSYAV